LQNAVLSIAEGTNQTSIINHRIAEQCSNRTMQQSAEGETI